MRVVYCLQSQNQTHRTGNNLDMGIIVHILSSRSIMEESTIITETDRLILRRYMGSDLQDLYNYLSNSEVVKYEPYKPMNMD